jgi:hypothetical protein
MKHGAGGLEEAIKPLEEKGIGFIQDVQDLAV